VSFYRAADRGDCLYLGTGVEGSIRRAERSHGVNASTAVDDDLRSGSEDEGIDHAWARVSDAEIR